jgi:ribulose-phosphate 3-epimerase
MKISASIYSNHDKDLPGLVRELDAYHIDYFHIDCNDDPSVFEDIEIIRECSTTEIDLHLITSKPEKYWDLIKKYNIELVTLQYENLEKKLEIPPEITAQIGLSLVSETSIKVFEQYHDICSFILFMTTTPGRSGGVFDRETFRRIREFKSMYDDKKIHVDGGINAELSFILRNMGVYSAVIGSYLFYGDFIGSAMIKLRSDNIESRWNAMKFRF